MSDIEDLEGGDNDGALFLGFEEGDRVFWDYRTGELVKPNADLPYQLGDEWVGDYISESDDLGLWSESSRLGAFLKAVATHSSATGMLGQKQATVYALREIVGISRKHTARALDMPANTVDSTLQTARAKVDAFRAVSESLGV